MEKERYEGGARSAVVVKVYMQKGTRVSKRNFM